MDKLERQLFDIFVKKAPYQLPESTRQSIAKALPWVTLLGGILMVWLAWTAWQIVTWASQWASTVNELGLMYGGPGYVAPAVAWGPLLWISLGLLIAEAILFFIAYPALRDFKKKGWNILFFVSLLNIAHSLVDAIAYTNIGSLVVALIGAALSLYILMQVRAYYTGEKKANPTIASPHQTPAATTTAKDAGRKV